MPNYTYLIVGGGMTAAAAIAGIREVDHEGTIGVVAAEPHPPYNRPPLSKALWKGEPLESIWRKLDPKRLTLHLGRTAQSLDPRSRRVVDDQGATYTYSKLLLATGCTPRRFPFGHDQILYFRTLDDYQLLRRQTEHGRHFAVIGAGFIGSELAAALAMSGKQVTLIYPHECIGSGLYPPELALFLNGYYREKGVGLLPAAHVIGCQRRDGQTVLQIRSEQLGGAGAGGGTGEIMADGVVAGIGVEPNVELARSAGLAVDNGIYVDASLRATQEDIYAAGDVASFHNPVLNRRLRVEHEDNANTMGALAGQAMAGRPVSYDHLPFFYSDLFDLGYEAVGELDASLQMVIDWKVPCREGVVYYLRDGRVRGVLLWGIFGQVEAARHLMASPGPFSEADLKGRLPA